MSPVYMNPQHSSSFPFLEFKGDQQLSLPTIIGYVHDHVTNTNNSYFSGSNLENHHGTTTQFLAMDYSRCTQEKVVEKLILSSHGHKPIVYPFDNRDQGNQKNEIIKNDEKPKKCKPSKIRILQKSTGAATTKCKKIMGDNDKGSRDQHHLATAQPDQQRNTYRATSHHHEANNNINGIRMCSDCHTTTTPLWRSGPQGPKSLCNACGIRQRKARKAAMAAATAGFTKDSTLTSSTIVEPPKLIVDEDITSENKLPLKKRSKTFNACWNYNDNNYNNNDNNDIYVDNNYGRGEKHCFEDFGLGSTSKNYSKASGSSQRVFPRDEEEGAILLMALSCGLACSS